MGRPVLVFNMDETPLEFDLAHRTTYDFIGKKEYLPSEQMVQRIAAQLPSLSVATEIS
jgi:hypothetical protein